MNSCIKSIKLVDGVALRCLAAKAMPGVVVVEDIAARHRKRGKPARVKMHIAMVRVKCMHAARVRRAARGRRLSYDCVS